MSPGALLRVGPTRGSGTGTVRLAPPTEGRGGGEGGGGFFGGQGAEVEASMQHA